MEFRETLLAAQRNQQQKSSDNAYYKARFDPPKKEQKQRDRLSANIQKFLAKKDEEEKLKKIEAQKKKDDLLAMRDPKALRKIQKTLKVIKSANKAAILDAVDNDNTAVTLNGPDQPDQDDYGYESQEAAALYAKMMQKYSKIPDEPKFPTGNQSVKKDLNGTRERVRNALQSEEEPVPHKRRRRTENGDRDISPPSRYEPEKERKKEDSKSDKPKQRRPMPPPLDFNTLLKLAEQKKSEPVDAVQKKQVQESENERLMTKKQKREYEEEMARRQRRQERIDAEAAKGTKPKHPKEDRPVEKERKPEPGGIGRIPKLSDKINGRNDSPKPDRERFEKMQREKERSKVDREKNDREKERLEKERLDKERLDRLKAERERIDRDIARLNIDRERLDKAKTKLETKATDKPSKPVDNAVDRSKLSSKENLKKNIDLKSQNTYRIDKNSNEKKLPMPNKGSNGKYINGHSSSQSKPVPKSKEPIPQKNGVKEKEREQTSKPRMNDVRPENGKRLPERDLPKRSDAKNMPQGNPKLQASSSKPKPPTSSFDFDKHINSLGKNGHAVNKNGVKRPDGMKKRPHPDSRMKQKRRAVDSDSEYDSELDDFIDDGDEEMDYSKHIKEIFGYDKSKYRDMDDDDDPDMESSFARQQREEYISKKIGIMEDLEDMRMEAMMKKKTKKGRRISDDD